MKLPSDRFSYSAMPQRRAIALPGGARIAVYVVVNVEDWDFRKPIVRQYVPSPAAVPVVPDVQNWAWHEYGLRVGFWRLLEALSRRGLKASAPINARLCESYEPVARAMLEAGWEFVGHGVVQGAMHAVPDQREAIQTSMRILSDFAGRAPKGWLGPGMAETGETLDLLAEAGFGYVCDWAMDEHPVEMATDHGPVVAMPYSLETGDLPMMVAHHHESESWLRRLRDQFDRLYAEGETQPRIMSLSVHPYIMGVPHRIGYFEQALDHFARHDGVWFATAGEIYDWYRAEAREG